MNLTIKGKRALIMGASRGLGFAVAKESAGEGVITAICSSNKENIERAPQKIGAVPFQADLSKPGFAKRSFFTPFSLSRICLISVQIAIALAGNILLKHAI